MTNTSHQQSMQSPREKRLSRRVSSLKIARPNLSDPNVLSEGELSPKSTPERHQLSPASNLLTRQVSHDGLASLAEKENDTKLPASGSGRASPIRCVSACDKVSLSLKRECEEENVKYISSVVDVPRSRIGRHYRSLFVQHETSLRIEADLNPMRLILFRLMTNLHFNRKGIFNVPVDPIALGLSDYTKIVTHPMDLGTIKNRLHAVAYQCRRQVADDIRLCFHNAMRYSPSLNFVHVSAKELLAFFEDQVACFCPDLIPNESCTLTKPSHEVTDTFTDQVSFLKSSYSAACSFANSHDDTVCPDTTVTSPPSTSADVTLNPKSQEWCVPAFPVSLTAHKRKKRGSKSMVDHNCQWCSGNICAICDQGCLPLEPTLLICNGPHCVGIRIRKGAIYFIAPDGSIQYCQRCYAGLAAVLPQAGKHEEPVPCRYKRNLLKRKNDEETAEQWITCSRCQLAVHRMCVMFNPFVHVESNFCCPSCVEDEKDDSLEMQANKDTDAYTFVAGSSHPIPMSQLKVGADAFTAEALPETAVSAFIQMKVRECMASVNCPNAERTVVVRIISECERFFKIPEVIRKHFHMRSKDDPKGHVVPPCQVLYRSKAIALFQKHDGFDVCIFCMFVQEYNTEKDEFKTSDEKGRSSQQKRVYVAYLDSVDHFRPRECRTRVYQEVLTAYLASARMRGYEAAHIWACPPSRGNSFVFNNHPAAQRTPNMERLTAWYHSALSRAMDCGVVSDVKSLYESDFEDSMERIKSSNWIETNRMTCPPLFEGDFWIEEALRVHSITLSRYSKDKAGCRDDDVLSTSVFKSVNKSCPALHVAALIRDKVISHPSSAAFRRPVNAAALNLKDYHRIISKPMDLGTVHSRCVLGEYNQLKDLVADMDLIWANAMKFNPPEHVVHLAAISVRDIFLSELNDITELWTTELPTQHSWKLVADISLSLDTYLHNDGEFLVEGNSTIEGVFANAAATSDNQLSIADPETGKSIAPDADAYPKQRCFPAVVSTDGNLVSPTAVLERMVGRDRWLLEKKSSILSRGMLLAKKSKRVRRSADVSDEPVSKRRRQTWLGEEVGAAVRRMRTSFFKCYLVPDSKDTRSDGEVDKFQRYTKEYKDDDDLVLRSSRVADARHALLEFSQFRGLEFDTLRRAKYSSAILLYYLHNEGAPGVIPECSSCAKPIEGVRWHRLHRVIQRRPVATVSSHVGRKLKVLTPPVGSEIEELCASCYAQHSFPDVFIPLQVSM